MTVRRRLAELSLCALIGWGCQPVQARRGDRPLDIIARAARPELTAFSSEADLARFLRDLERAERENRSAHVLGAAAEGKLSCVPETCESLGVDCGVHSNGCGTTLDCGSCGSASESPHAAAEAAVEPDAAESITNVQHAGVDEGSIVKRRGHHLIVLRRGRLFTISLKNGELRPVSSSDAFGPGIDPSASWFDEILVADDLLVVIGYSYARGGTEIGVFELDPHGRLRHRSTHQLRSNDYYSARNYASRLIGSRLVFYAPRRLGSERDPERAFPALRRWPAERFERTAAATNVYRPLFAMRELTLHTVTACDLASQELECESTVVLGPSSRVFYVSPGSVYVWVSERGRDSVVYRLPLDGSTPSALRTIGHGGAPVDQFSFLERGERLYVLVRGVSGGDGMWNAEASSGDVALLSAPLAAFSRRVRRLDRSSYTALPKPDGRALQNRFVSDHVLYGTGSGWGRPLGSRGELFVHSLAASPVPTVRLPLPHGVDRIEALGDDAIVIGSDERDLHFSPVALDPQPWLGPRLTRRGASQGELRSHGFFYRPDGPRRGILGLPIRGSGRPGNEHLIAGSASVSFVRNHALSLSALGELRPLSDAESLDDDCRASCVDWYGNARPLFVEDRIFALLGYEIVEGELWNGRLREKRRVSFAPAR